MVAAAGVRPRNRMAWRKHATAASKALELLAVHATGDTASVLASTEAMEVMVALCALPPPPPPPCAIGEFAADPDALEADQEQMMIYVEEMLVAGSALTGAYVRPRAHQRMKELAHNGITMSVTCATHNTTNLRGVLHADWTCIVHDTVPAAPFESLRHARHLSLCKHPRSSERRPESERNRARGMLACRVGGAVWQGGRG